MNSIDTLSKTECVGCRSCVQICPKHAISMKEDIEGFYYPVISDKCVECGVCKKHCPIMFPENVYNEEKECYGVILKNKEALLKSSSGGAFVGIAEFFLENNGVVYGASYIDNLKVNHIRITQLKDIEKLQGSKYIESNTDDTFSLVKNDLLSGKNVLYSGCPCQIAGLRKFLSKNYQNLYTIDLVCHGVPSQKFFSEYISWLENRIGERVIYYGFRDKNVGGWSCGGKFRTRTRTRTRTFIASADPFYASFLRGEIYRESCYTCSFANMKRIGDFTIGDLWGAKQIVPKMYRKNGVSFISINTEKAKNIFAQIKNKFYYKECKITEVAKYNHNLNAPTMKTPNRKVISENIQNYGYKYTFEHIETKNFTIEFLKECIKDFLRFCFSIFERRNYYGK